MTTETNFELDIPFLLDDKQVTCAECNQFIFVGDYVQEHVDLFYCRECLLKKGYALGPRIKLLSRTVTEDKYPDETA